MPDLKITELTEKTAPAATDLAVIVDDPGGTPATRKATLLNVVKGVLDAKNAALGSDVAINSGNNTWVDGPSLSLGAGTWLVMAHVTLIKSATTLVNWQARISDGTTHYASGQAISVSNNPQGQVIAMTTLIVLGSTTTIKVQATATAAASTLAIRAATVTNGSGNNATQITAIRVA